MSSSHQTQETETSNSRFLHHLMNNPAKYTRKLSLQPTQILVLLGLKHCGKTSLAHALAQYLKRPQYDSDQLLEQYYAAQQPNNENPNFREIYRKLGKNAFDSLQLQVLQDFFAHFFAQQAPPKLAEKSTPIQQLAPVLSLGGGSGDLAELDPLLLHKNCLVVLLEEELPVLFQRITKQGSLPAFLQHAQNHEHAYSMFCQLSKQRLQRYQKWASLIVSCQQRTPETLLLELQQRLSPCNT